MYEKSLENSDGKNIVTNNNYITNYVDINLGISLPAIITVGMLCVLLKGGLKLCSKKS